MRRNRGYPSGPTAVLPAVPKGPANGMPGDHQQGLIERAIEIAARGAVGLDDVLRAMQAVAPRSAAGVLFTDQRGRVLLVEPTYKPYWDLPGGVIEAGEPPRRTAERELVEELGQEDLTVGRLLVVDAMPDGTFRFVFEGRADFDYPIHLIRFMLPPGELRAFRWCTQGEQRARQIKAPLLARRVAEARRAMAAGTTLYLEARP